MKRRLVFLAAIAAAPPAAIADEIAPKARRLAERGMAMHAAGNYAGAIEAFKEAYVIGPSPALLFNLAQAYRLQGDCEDASLMYHRYLSSDPPDNGREIAEANIVAVDRCARDHQPVPPPPPHPPPAGSVRLAAVQNDDVPPPNHGRLEQNVGLGFAIGGAIVLGGALYFAVDAFQAQRDVDELYATGGTGKDVTTLDERGRSSAMSAKLLAAGGTLAVIGGVALYYAGVRTERARPAVAIVPVNGGGHVSMSWAW